MKGHGHDVADGWSTDLKMDQEEGRGSPPVARPNAGGDASTPPQPAHRRRRRSSGVGDFASISWLREVFHGTLMVQDHVGADGSLLNFQIRGGARFRLLFDVYHLLLGMRWWVLVLVTFAVYSCLAALFALAYLADPAGANAGVKNAAPVWGDAFFFSVQTISTIGYGTMAPQSAWAHVWVLLESFVGLMLHAVITGLVFSKMSHPRVSRLS